MKKLFASFVLSLAALSVGAQGGNFVFNGRVNMPNGTVVGLSCSTDTAFSVKKGETVVKNGRFRLKGKTDRPYPGMLTTNNMDLVERNHWPQDSIRWTYTDVFVDKGEYTVDPDLVVTGPQAQADFLDLQRVGGQQASKTAIMQFIDAHPQSAVTQWLACNLLKRAYNLTAADVEHLAATVKACPTDPVRYQELEWRLAAARTTTIGMPLIGLQVRDVNNKVTDLLDVVPHNGKYVLLDFWASWCGICLHSMPEVKAIREAFADRLDVVGISIDEKEAAWRKAMEKHPEPWAQYCTTAEGYRDLTTKFQIGNGVPYYLLLAPDGKVISSPKRPSCVERYLLEQTSQYHLVGTVDSLEDGDSVFVCSMQGFFAMVPEDTAVVKDGRFDFRGKIDGATLRYIVGIHGGQSKSISPFILEAGRTDMELYQDSRRDRIDGGMNYRLYKEFERGDSSINAQMEQPWAITRDSTLSADVRAKAQATLDSLQQVQKKYHKKFIVDHIPSALSDMLFGLCSWEMKADEQEAMLKILGERQPQYPVYRQKMAERAATERTGIGKKYTDVALAGTDGKTVRVSDYVSKNKYTLIDFWASWCGPCRAEMPNVVKAYTKWHKRGFEVVGVSLDNNKAAWVKALKTLKMPWPQMSDLKGWESAGAAVYNVKAIPANVLVDRDGTIVAKDLRGEDLQQKLAELMK